MCDSVKSRNVPRQPQSAQQQELGRQLWQQSLERAQQLADSGQQQPVAWRKDSEDSSEMGL